MEDNKETTIRFYEASYLTHIAHIEYEWAQKLPKEKKELHIEALKRVISIIEKSK